MPATFTCASVRPNNGIRQIHLTVVRSQPNDALFNFEDSVLKDIFGVEVRGGDTWSLSATLVSRAGTNGMNRG